MYIYMYVHCMYSMLYNTHTHTQPYLLGDISVIRASSEQYGVEMEGGRKQERGVRRRERGREGERKRDGGGREEGRKI